MELTRISRIKGYRIFRDYTWPAGLNDFGRFNVIYGWNGAGKTTLSTLLRHVEQQQPISDGRVEFMFGNRVVNGASLMTEPVPKVRVFNRDFVGRAVFESGGGQLPPVYYFGEDSADKQRRIVELTEQLQKQRRIQGEQAEHARKASQALEAYCTEQARSIRNLLTVAGGGPYNNYDAKPFKHQIRTLVVAQALPERLSAKVRNAHLQMRESKARPSLPTVAVKFPDLADLRARTARVLQASVVSAVLEDLANDHVVAGWVGQGLALHRGGDRLSNTCRFCAQPLPATRIVSIEAHFNDEFKRLKQAVAGLLVEVEQALAFEQRLSAPPAEALYESLRAEYEKAIVELRTHSHTLSSALKALKEALLAKQEDPFKQIELAGWLKSVKEGEGFGHMVLSLFALVADGTPFLASFAGTLALTRLNETISQHNSLTVSFDESVKKARSALAQDEVLAALDGWKACEKAINDAEKARDAAKAEVDRLSAEITALEAQVRQHHQPAEELNLELAGYLGRSELKFVAEQNGYRIVRGDQPAMHLSDGERTAMELLIKTTSSSADARRCSIFHNVVAVSSYSWV